MIAALQTGTKLSFERATQLTIKRQLYYSSLSERALYQVCNELDGLEYTLKIFALHPDQTLDEVRREVIALNRQNQHPERLPRVRGVEHHDGFIWVLVDWMDGTPLDFVTRSAAATTREDLLLRLAIAHEVCATVALIHDCRTVHRDLKPQNLLLRESNRPAAGAIVLDFGLAAQPRVEAIEGTFGYAAPEQQKNRHLNLKPQTDVFALGQILCFLLLGAPLPLTRASGANSWQDDIPSLIRTHSAMPLPDALVALMADCLSFLPERRPPHARAVMNRLKSLERQRP